jgi:hypothetical protein
MILKIFSPKNSAQKSSLFLLKLLLVFAKIVIITSTPSWGIRGKKVTKNQLLRPDQKQTHLKSFCHQYKHALLETHYYCYKLA